MKKLYLALPLLLIMTVLPVYACAQQTVEDTAKLSAGELEGVSLTLTKGDTVDWEFEEKNDAVEISVLWCSESDYNDAKDGKLSTDEINDLKESKGKTKDDGTIEVDEAGDMILAFLHDDTSALLTEAEVDYKVSVTKAIVPGYDVSILLICMGFMSLGVIFIIMKKRR